MRITDRDRFLLGLLRRYHLTTRLIRKLSVICGQPFRDQGNLSKCLGRLEGAGFLKRKKLLISGENYHFLTNAGVELSKTNDVRLSPRATSPIKPALESHELLLSIFMTLVEISCHDLKVPFPYFLREGQFTADVKIDDNTFRLKPDGVIILKVKGKHRVFFLEIDRSTETVKGANHINTKSFEAKIDRYTAFYDQAKEHPLLKDLEFSGFRVITMCLTKERMENLLEVARKKGKKGMFCFSHVGLVIEGDVTTANDWNYRLRNVISSKTFLYPGGNNLESILAR